jgi:hypothetical protein
MTTRYAVLLDPPSPALDALAAAADTAEREAGRLAVASFALDTPESLRAYAAAEDAAAEAHEALAVALPRRTARERERAAFVAAKAEAGQTFAKMARAKAAGLESWS